MPRQLSVSGSLRVADLPGTSGDGRVLANPGTQFSGWPRPVRGPRALPTDRWMKPACMSASIALRPTYHGYRLVCELATPPGGVPADRGACGGVNGEAQCRPACDVERKMGADVDTAQSHQGDGGQGEGAAARAETGQGSH